MKEKREEFIDILRILSTLAVITIHVGGEHWMSMDVFSFQWDVLNFYRTITRWAVPMFVMISGTLFLSREKLDVRRLYLKNLLRIIVAFVFWSTIYALFDYDGSVKFLISSIVRGPGHFWFLFLIAGIYVIMPIMKILLDKFGGTLVVFFILVGFVFPSIVLFIPEIIGKSFLSDTWIIIVKLVQKSCGWSGYLCLGRWLYNKQLSRVQRYFFYIVGAASMASSFFIFKWYAYRAGYATNEIYDNISITILIECVALFILFKEISWRLSSKAQRILRYISKCTFGIYLVHMLIFYAIDSKTYYFALMYPIYSVPVVVVMVFAISLCISMIINKIPYINKYIV